MGLARRLGLIAGTGHGRLGVGVAHSSRVELSPVVPGAGAGAWLGLPACLRLSEFLTLTRELAM